MKKARSDIWVRRGGFACGVAAVVVALGAARVPAQPRDLGLDLSVTAAPSTVLTVKPPKPLIVVAGMRAGGREGVASGRATVVNSSQQAQRVRLRALPSTRALDRGLQVHLTLAGKPLYHGPVAGLRTPTRDSIVLLSGNSAPLRMRVALRADAERWRGRIEDVDLSFDAEPVEAP